MKAVSRFEANLLRLLYFFLKREPAERALPLLDQRSAAPPCLSRAAVELVQDALAKGCTTLLTRRGGWRDERHLRGDRVAGGRLWQRTAPADLGLHFSRHALRFLLWITAARPDDEKPQWGPAERELTPADLLLLYFAQEELRDVPDGLGAAALWRRQPYVRHGLCWLAFPGDFAKAPADAVPNFAPWTTGLGACILEALQPELAERWVEVEIGKGQVVAPQAMQELGRAQDKALGAFLDAAEAAGRPDLARFLLRAASIVLTPNREAAAWVAGLKTASQRLADRAATYQAALAFPRGLERLQAWQRRARTVGYFDEGYVVAQLWKADWEHFQGDALCERARALAGQLDPMKFGH